MPVKSLIELTSAVCIKHIKGLESIGDLPYASVRHILLRVDSAYQLRRIELNSSQIQGETGEIWLKIIERDFPLEYKSKGYKPQNATKWYRVWEKYKGDHDRSLQESEEQLKSALAGLRQDREKNTSQIVDHNHKYLPRHGRIGPKRGFRDTTTSVLMFGGGSRTKTANGASVMRKVRREVKEIRNIHGSLSRPIRAPMRSAQLKSAPTGMMVEKRIASQPSYRAPTRDIDDEGPSAVTEHEQRAAFISDSEEDEDYDQDQDGHHHRGHASRSPPKPGPKPHIRKSGGSALQRKFGGGSSAPVQQPQRRPAAASPPKKSSHSQSARDSSHGSTATSKVAQYLPRPQNSPPPADSPSPPAPASAAAPAPQAQPVRKRKAVDIFMRPKKRF